MLYAHCHRSGEITINSKPDIDGLICLGHGRNHQTFRDTVEAISRLSKDNQTLLVTGLPEADTEAEAEDAAVRFSEMLEQRIAA